MLQDAPLQLPTGQLLAFPKPSLPAMDMGFTLEKGTADSAGLFIRLTHALLQLQWAESLP